MTALVPCENNILEPRPAKSTPCRELANIGCDIAEEALPIVGAC